uniref:Putative glycosyltransferase n=1 Tax=viral metagenome TaxID=1070528 RepID=A0A6M3L3M7_9ZZZZ
MSNGFATDLTVIIPGRNEEFHAQTVEDVLSRIQADTEVISILDGDWPPNRGIDDHPRAKVVKTTTAIGQRAATNLGAQMSRAKYIMKLDAHCRMDDGFDVKMIERMQPEYTMVPQMYRLHAFDWTCNNCGWGQYQGTKPDKCEECGEDDLFKKLVWEPKWKVGPTVSWRFDSEIHFQYWNDHRKWPEVREEMKTGVVETMSCIGCCFMMERDRFLSLGGMDEGHGSWGQYGAELACKSWLSGGKMVSTTDTWSAHLFRTGNFSRKGESTFPYPLSGVDQEKARTYSRDFWRNGRWDKQVRPLSWLVEKFWPVPGWDESDLQAQKKRERSFKAAA